MKVEIGKIYKATRYITNMRRETVEITNYYITVDPEYAISITDDDAAAISEMDIPLLDHHLNSKISKLVRC